MRDEDGSVAKTDQFWGRATCSRFIGVGAIKIGFIPGFRDDSDAGFGGDPIQRDVAADPPCPACRGRERLSFDDGGGREGETGDEQQVFHAPRSELVLHEIEK